MKRFVIPLSDLGMVIFSPGAGIELPISREKAVQFILGNDLALQDRFPALEDGEPLERPNGRRARRLSPASPVPQMMSRGDKARRTIAQRKAEGLCTKGCGRPASKDSPLCVQHLKKASDARIGRPPPPRSPQHLQEEQAVLRVMRSKAAVNGMRRVFLLEAAGLALHEGQLALARLRKDGKIKSVGRAIAALIFLVPEAQPPAIKVKAPPAAPAKPPKALPAPATRALPPAPPPLRAAPTPDEIDEKIVDWIKAHGPATGGAIREGLGAAIGATHFGHAMQRIIYRSGRLKSVDGRWTYVENEQEREKLIAHARQSRGRKN